MFCFVFFHVNKPLNLHKNYFEKPDDMSHDHFSHHMSLYVKADVLFGYLSNCTEEVAHSLAMSQRVAMVIATQRETS